MADSGISSILARSSGAASAAGGAGGVSRQQVRTPVQTVLAAQTGTAGQNGAKTARRTLVTPDGQQLDRSAPRGTYLDIVI
jgi:hypothetical protein